MAQQYRNRIESNYRGHKIIAALTKDGPLAATYLGKSLATDLRFEGQTVEGAVNEAKAWIDLKYNASSADRPAPNIGLVGEYLDALTARPPKNNELAMLKHHATYDVLTATQLAQAAGYSSYSSANVHYGQFGKAIAEILHLRPELREDGSEIWTSILASPAEKMRYGNNEDGEHFRWKIHENLKQALQQIGIA